MPKTSIEWTDMSINPIRARLNGHVGHYCEKTSPGCKNCYSSHLQPRFGMPPFKEQRGNSAVEHFFDVSKLKEVLRRRKPTKFFWCDMTDMFGEWVPEGWIAACFATMAATHWHTHQVLTKRADRMRRVVPELYANDGERLIESAEWLAGEIDACHVGEDEWKFPLGNVHLGVSCEDQPRADERIPHLLATPAAVRFVSAEPLLGALDLTALDAERAGHDGLYVVDALTGRNRDMGRPCRDAPARLDWVIVGGESGPGARMFELPWGESLVKQCRDAGVPMFFKQVGAKPVHSAEPTGNFRTSASGERQFQLTVVPLRISDRKGGNPLDWPESLRVRQFPCPGEPPASGRTGNAGVGSDARPTPAGSSEVS
ncbi:MAG TPA: DUF5131 family protein [Polyangiaceae bacterium]|jgi:protein gp37|nr:DUF5131 family protein [Polyangiaceae bacterium]